jgi:hypothetical protein
MREDGNGVHYPARLGIIILASVVAAAVLAAGSSKRTLEIKPGLSGVIGYGTLISQRSLEQTLRHKYAGQAYPVHVTGFVRSWSLRRPFNAPGQGTPAQAKTGVAYRSGGPEIPFSGIVELNVHPQKDGRLNGVLYLLNEEDLRKVDERERAYKRRDVTGQVEEFAFAGGRVSIYEGLPVDPATAAADPKEFVLFKENLDSVLRACDSVGHAFRAEFEKSTSPVAYRIISIGDVLPVRR